MFYSSQVNTYVTFSKCNYRSFGNRKIATAHSLKIEGLTIDTTLTWKHHIRELTSRLNKACYAIRSIKPFMSLDVLRSTFFVCSLNCILWNYILGEFIL